MNHRTEKQIRWLCNQKILKKFSDEAKEDVGSRLELLQQGRFIQYPLSDHMPSICQHCHELRKIQDKNIEWRIIYRIDPEVIVIVEVFKKQSKKTPKYI